MLAHPCRVHVGEMAERLAQDRRVQGGRCAVVLGEAFLGAGGERR